MLFVFTENSLFIFTIRFGLVMQYTLQLVYLCDWNQLISFGHLYVSKKKYH